MSAKQKVKISGVVRLKTKSNGKNTKTKVSKNGNSRNGKRGNPRRCPACGRFL